GFVDLFSGAGGFALGFARAGLRALLCVDIGARSTEATHRHNFPDVRFVRGDLGLPDVQRVAVSAVREEPFVVVGGPPCQGFSVFGKRRLLKTEGPSARNDPRNRLVFSFVDCVEKLRPKWVVMENVPGFVSLDGGEFLAALVKELRRLG